MPDLRHCAEVSPRNTHGERLKIFKIIISGLRQKLLGQHRPCFGSSHVPRCNMDPTHPMTCHVQKPTGCILFVVICHLSHMQLRNPIKKLMVLDGSGVAISRNFVVGPDLRTVFAKSLAASASYQGVVTTSNHHLV